MNPTQWLVTVAGFRSGLQHFVVTATNARLAEDLAYLIISRLDDLYEGDSFTLNEVFKLEEQL